MITPAPVSQPTGLAQLSLSYKEKGEVVTFRYNPTEISFSKAVKTENKGTVLRSLEQTLTEADILTFDLKALRMEGKQALSDIGVLLNWLVCESGPPAAPSAAPSSGTGIPPAPPPTPAGPSAFTSAIMARRAAVTGQGPQAASTNAGRWGKNTSSGGGKSSNDRGKPKELELRMGTGQGYVKGDGISGPVILKKVDVTYSRFNAAGDPIRAEVTIKLETCQSPDPPTNPTSFSPDGGRVHLTSGGDNLQRIAQETYRTPSAWRAIAEANGIDDPLRVGTGRTLLLPYAGTR